MPERRGRSHAFDSPVPGECTTHEQPGQTEKYWKSPRMPLQYAEKINAARSGMARAAAATGRDEADQIV